LLDLADDEAVVMWVNNHYYNEFGEGEPGEKEEVLAYHHN
jgi:hypothetical protein